MSRVKAERRVAAELIRIETPRAGRGTERLGEERLQFVVGYLFGERAE